jgi:hypothetical protein
MAFSLEIILHLWPEFPKTIVLQKKIANRLMDELYMICLLRYFGKSLLTSEDVATNIFNRYRLFVPRLESGLIGTCNDTKVKFFSG